MTASIALRRALRRLPACRALSGPALDALLARLTERNYQPGELLWPAPAPPHFVALIQSGEVVLERYVDGVVAHAARLAAGDLVRAAPLPPNGHVTLTARAATAAHLYLFSPADAACLGAPGLSQPAARVAPARALPWRRLWVAALLLLFLALAWPDLARLAAGGLYALAGWLGQPTAPHPLLASAAALDRRAVFAQNQAGYLWFQHGDLPQAEAVFAAALARDPHSAPLLNNLAVAYYQTEQLPQAVAYLQRAVQQAPDSAVVHYNLGAAWLAQGRAPEALREFKQATYIDAAWPLPHLQLGCLYLQLGDYPNAERSAAAAARLDPASSTAQLILAIAWYHQGQARPALETLERILQAEPHNQVAAFYKAQVLSDLGEYDLALALLARLRDEAHAPSQIARLSAEIAAVQFARQNVSAWER